MAHDHVRRSHRVIALLLLCGLHGANTLHRPSSALQAGRRCVSGRRLACVRAAASDADADRPSGETQPSEALAPMPLPKGSAFLLLNVVACVWGTQHPVIKQCVEAGYAQTHSALEAAGLINLGRFAIGALLFSPFLPPISLAGSLPASPEPMVPAQVGRAAAAAASWRYGAELGLWSFAGFALQAIGLEFTTASRSAFLLYLNVKLVPLLSRALYNTPIPPSTWASALAAFCGTALLSSDGLAPNVGDAWSALAALASAFFILRLQEASAACAGSGRSLNAVTLLVACALCALWCAAIAIVRAPDALAGGDVAAAYGGGAVTALGVELAAFGHDASEFAATEWRPLLYLGVVCTGLCSWAQTTGQRSVGAEQAAIVYATDPLWAAFFSWLSLGESLGARGWAGAALIFAAAVSTQVLALSMPPADGALPGTTSADPGSDAPDNHVPPHAGEGAAHPAHSRDE